MRLFTSVFIKHNGYQLTKTNCLQTAKYRATRGHSYKLRLNLHAVTFSNQAINTWNQLPENAANAPFLNVFKSSLNRHWHEHQYMKLHVIKPTTQLKNINRVLGNVFCHVKVCQFVAKGRIIITSRESPCRPIFQNTCNIISQ